MEVDDGAVMFPQGGCVRKSEAVGFEELVAFKLSFQGFH